MMKRLHKTDWLLVSESQHEIENNLIIYTGSDDELELRHAFRFVHRKTSKRADFVRVRCYLRYNDRRVWGRISANTKQSLY